MGVLCVHPFGHLGFVDFRIAEQHSISAPEQGLDGGCLTFDLVILPMGGLFPHSQNTLPEIPTEDLKRISMDLGVRF